MNERKTRVDKSLRRKASDGKQATYLYIKNVFDAFTKVQMWIVVIGLYRLAVQRS
jgi:hypothetical protein